MVLPTIYTEEEKEEKEEKEKEEKETEAAKQDQYRSKWSLCIDIGNAFFFYEIYVINGQRHCNCSFSFSF